MQGQCGRSSERRHTPPSCVFRIADRRHPVWDGTGAMLMGGRFNRPGRPIIYGALTYAGAMLEVLVHSAIGRVPLTEVVVTAEVPDDVAIERAGAKLAFSLAGCSLACSLRCFSPLAGAHR